MTPEHINWSFFSFLFFTLLCFFLNHVLFLLTFNAILLASSLFYLTQMLYNYLSYLLRRGSLLHYLELMGLAFSFFLFLFFLENKTWLGHLHFALSSIRFTKKKKKVKKKKKKRRKGGSWSWIMCLFGFHFQSLYWGHWISLRVPI